MDSTIGTERRVVWSLIFVVVLSAALVAALQPGVVRFWPFSVQQLFQLISPLFLVALFIERVLEVLLTSWRGAESRELRVMARGEIDATDVKDPKKALVDYQSRTQRIAFLSGTAIGVIVSALGIRVLELFVDPAVFDSLPRMQQTLFRMTDVLFTGAVLGGGSDGLHRLVKVFTSFMDSTARLAAERCGGSASP